MTQFAEEARAEKERFQRERVQRFGVSAATNDSNRAAGQGDQLETYRKKAESQARMAPILEKMRADAPVSEPLTDKQKAEQEAKRIAKKVRDRLGGRKSKRTSRKSKKVEENKVY